MTELTRMRSLGQKCLKDPLSVPYMSSRRCKAQTLLIDWRSCGGIVTEEVLFHWLRLHHTVCISLTACRRPQKSMLEKMFLQSLVQKSHNPTPEVLVQHNIQQWYLITSYAKLPRILALLSRHSSCLDSWLPGWRCQRVCPLSQVANSITPINLAGEWNGDQDCFAWVKINTTD